MRYFAGIDLHSTNSVLDLLDATDRVVLEKRLPNDLGIILSEMEPYQREVEGVVVESTYNWYWLVDGLRDAGYQVHLAHPAGNEQYRGLKHVDDRHDARWLAHLLRLGILHEGHVLCREDRAVRDLLRKRGHLVRERTRHILSVGNLIERNTAIRLKGGKIQALSREQVVEMLAREQALAVTASLEVLRCLGEQIRMLEKEVRRRVRPRVEWERVSQMPGIGEILGWTIVLESGPVSRFPGAGHYASYSRCVGSRWMSNGKGKGRGNRKNGNRYLGWAFMEAAHFAVRYDARIRRYYQRRCARGHCFAASKAVASKLAKACYYILRDGVSFEVERAF